MRIAETDQIQERTYYRGLEPLVQFGPGIVMTVDVTDFAGPWQQIQVVRPSQQTKVIDLGHSGSKELNGAGYQIIIVAAAQGFVIGAIYLIDVQIVGSCPYRLEARTVAPLVNRFHKIVDFFQRKQPGRAVRTLSIWPDVDQSNSVVSIEHGDGVARSDFQPLLQAARCPGIESV